MQATLAPNSCFNLIMPQDSNAWSKPTPPNHVLTLLLVSKALHLEMFPNAIYRFMFSALLLMLTYYQRKHVSLGVWHTQKHTDRPFYRLAKWGHPELPLKHRPHSNARRFNWYCQSPLKQKCIEYTCSPRTARRSTKKLEKSATTFTTSDPSKPSSSHLLDNLLPSHTPVRDTKR